MSVNATGHAATIWSRATSALSSIPQAPGFDTTKPNEAGAASSKPNQAGEPRGTTPLQSLSSGLQSALIQMQAQTSAAA